jgi:hypothetical protein
MSSSRVSPIHAYRSILETGYLRFSFSRVVSGLQSPARRLKPESCQPQVLARSLREAL